MWLLQDQMDGGEKQRHRKARDKKYQANFTRFRKEGNHFRLFFGFWFFFPPPFCNFYNFLGGELGERL